VPPYHENKINMQTPFLGLFGKTAIESFPNIHLVIIFTVSGLTRPFLEPLRKTFFPNLFGIYLKVSEKIDLKAYTILI